MLSDATTDFFRAQLRYLEAPIASCEEHKMWQAMCDAERLVMMNARSFAEGRRIVQHVDYLARHVVFPTIYGVEELHHNICLKGNVESI